jgi:hypothetical protein
MDIIRKILVAFAGLCGTILIYVITFVIIWKGLHSIFSDNFNDILIAIGIIISMQLLVISGKLDKLKKYMNITINN